MPVVALKNFLRLESSAGILLVVATIAALLVSNSPLAGLYERLLNVPLSDPIAAAPPGALAPSMGCVP